MFKELISGSIAGLIATVPMTAVMVAGHTNLPPHHGYPLPPRRITERVTALLGIRSEVKRNDAMDLTTYTAHFGYGSAAGAVYGVCASHLPGPAAAKGIGYGLIVWGVSYLGLLPRLGLHRPATREPQDRNALMIVAHVVWGASLGIVADALARNSFKSPSKKS